MKTQRRKFTAEESSKINNLIHQYFDKVYMVNATHKDYVRMVEEGNDAYKQRIKEHEQWIMIAIRIAKKLKDEYGIELDVDKHIPTKYDDSIKIDKCDHSFSSELADELSQCLSQYVEHCYSICTTSSADMFCAGRHYADYEIGGWTLIDDIKDTYGIALDFGFRKKLVLPNYDDLYKDVWRLMFHTDDEFEDKEDNPEDDFQS